MYKAFRERFGKAAAAIEQLRAGLSATVAQLGAERAAVAASAADFLVLHEALQLTELVEVAWGTGEAPTLTLGFKSSSAGSALAPAAVSKPFSFWASPALPSVSSNVKRVAFHCDTQREIWRAALAHRMLPFLPVPAPADEQGR